MCGIAGLIRFDADLGREALEAHAGRMADAITHRGPDGRGCWSDPRAGVALSHRRLSILDLSDAGAQPMQSHGGRFTVVFNGEVYNHGELRAALPGRAWRGHSDTEVLLEAVAAWGLEEALRRAVGMFALALWDGDERTLSLARDRMGEKPLYYGTIPGALVFGSELKALRAAPGWQGEVDRVALDDFMRHGCVHGPRSIYRNVRKLPAGTALRVPLDDAPKVTSLAPSPWWSLLRVVERGAPPPVDDREAIDRLEALLAQAIAGQRVADVPVGAFLSGGIDSSTLVALMRAGGGGAVKTFSIGFHEPEFNEAPYARKVAEHLGTDHTELYVTLDEAREVIPALPEMYDEPFSDPSQLPTLLVAKLARRQVTVSLSGDGGDELFGGYSRYPMAERLWRALGPVPRAARAGAAVAMRSVPVSAWDALGRALPRRMRVASTGDKVYKLAGVVGARSGLEVYDLMLAHHREPTPVVLGVDEPTRVGAHPFWGGAGRHIYEDMMLSDALGYLPDVILVKVDRATMAVSLEARAPYLDHRVVEFAFNLPMRFKVRDRQSKWLLRRVLDRHVPRALIERPKMGFNVPIDAWLRGPLEGWASDLLSPALLAAQGYLHPGTIRAAWEGHRSGRRNLEHFLWNALMFQSWLARGG